MTSRPVTSRSGFRVPAMARLIAACAIALAFAGCASRQPVESQLTESSRSQRLQTLQDALEFSRTGEARNWQDAASGQGGSVLPMRTVEDGARGPCRVFQESITIAGRTEIAVGSACRGSDGLWTVTELQDYPAYPDRYYDDPYYYDPYYYDPFYYHPFYFSRFHGHYRHGLRHRHWRHGVGLGLGFHF